MTDTDTPRTTAPATEGNAPCQHRPDFYPSLMQWRCTRCGVPLHVAWPAHLFDKATKKEMER
jgi:hypothetical protein